MDKDEELDPEEEERLLNELADLVVDVFLKEREKEAQRDSGGEPKD